MRRILDSEGGFSTAGGSLRRWCAGVLFLSALLAASAAWAVAGSVSLTVQSPDGSPLQGAKISLGGVEVGTTDSSGQVEFEAEEGDHVVVVEHSEHGRMERTIAVPGGGAVSETVRMRTSAQQPPRTYAGGRTGVGIEVTDDSSEVEVTEVTIREVIIADGETVVDETTQVDPAAENEALTKTLNVTSLVAEFSWSFFGGGSSMSLRSAGLGNMYGARFGDVPVFAQRRYGDHPGPAPRRFRPTLSVWGGQGEVELEIEGKQDPTIQAEFSDEGLLWGAGLDFVWLVCDDCGWHVGAGVRYQTIEELEAEREPRLRFEGATTLRDRAELEYESQQAQLFVGYGLRYVAPYAGARWHRRELTFRGDQAFDISERAGFPLQVEVTSIVEEEADEVEGFAGIVVRLGDSRFYGRIEGATDGDNETVTAGVTVALGGTR